MKITFFANMPSFIEPIASGLAQDEEVGINSGNEYGVFISGNEQQFMSQLQTADILWFEWCNEYIIMAQNALKYTPAKIICRLHSYEAFSDFPFQVDWNRVDHLILVNESVKDVLIMTGAFEQIRKAKTKVHVVPNAVSCDRYSLVDAKMKRPHSPMKIGVLGHINYKKDSSLIFPISEYLRFNGHKFNIHIAGEIQDLRYKLMFDRYMKKQKGIHIDGHQKDVNGWFKDKMFVLNTSLFESFNYAIAEGMLSGCIPLIRNWEGADNVYPDIEKWTTMEDLESIIKKHLDIMTPEELSMVQTKNAKFIMENYDVPVVIEKIKPIVFGD